MGDWINEMLVLDGEWLATVAGSLVEELGSLAPHVDPYSSARVKVRATLSLILRSVRSGQSDTGRYESQGTTTHLRRCAILREKFVGQSNDSASKKHFVDILLQSGKRPRLQDDIRKPRQQQICIWRFRNIP